MVNKVDDLIGCYLKETSANQNNKDYMSLWSGQNAKLARAETVEQLIKRVVEEAKKISED